MLGLPGTVVNIEGIATGPTYMKEEDMMMACRWYIV